jgi:hypothetical protein
MGAFFKAWKPPIGVSVHRVISPIKFQSIASMMMMMMMMMMRRRID